MKSISAEVYSDTKELAEDLGVKTAYDDLSSDVSYFYPTKVKPLDIILGGGVPSGKVVELFGWESCLLGDTKIKLLNGNDVEIKDLVDKPEFWVYSSTLDGKIVPGRGHNARITRYTDEIFNITLDNGKVIQCTGNHPFLLRDGTYVNAENLIPGTSIMPIYTKLSEGYFDKYEMIQQNINGGYWEYTHHMVCYHFNKKKDGYEIHHKDRNKLNNDPDNLMLVTPLEHARIHGSDVSKRNKKNWENPEYQKKMSKVSLKTWENTEFRKKMNEVLRKASVENWKNLDRIEKQRIITRNKNNETGLFICEKCGKSYTKRASYFSHQRAHSPNINHNHKIVSVEKVILKDQVPVYDIEVDEYHNFALSAGVFVHNSGKSALALTFSKAFTEYWTSNNTKCVVLWIEAESAFDKMRARYFGCNLDHYMIVEALDIEEAFKKMEDAISMASRKGIKLFIVLDTIAALQTSKERISGEFSGGIAQKPRVVKQCLQKIVPLLGESDTTLILVNQVYSTLNAYGGSSFDSPGGGGIKFFSSIRGSVTVRRKDVEFTPSGEEITTGIVTEIFTKKNKITLPQQKCMIYLYGDKGIDILKTLYELMVKNKVFVGTTWKTYSSIKKIDNQYIPFEVKFQNISQLEKKSEVENVNIIEYLNYETTKIYSMSSPFIKVKYIEDLWKFEVEHFGEKKSTLTDEEKDLAKLIFERFSDDGGDDGEPMELE